MHVTTQHNPYDQKSMDFSDSNGTNPFNQFVSHLNSQFDNVKSSFDVMCLKENITKVTSQEMHFFKTMMIENVLDIRKVNSKLNSDNVTLLEHDKDGHGVQLTTSPHQTRFQGNKNSPTTAIERNIERKV